MKLSELLSSIDVPVPRIDPDIIGLSLDSKNLHVGYIFFALKGQFTDGCNYIQEAINNGASAIICDAGSSTKIDIKNKVPIISVRNLKEKIGIIANNFYQTNAHSIKITGITGTNGKTTCAYILSQSLSKLNKRCAFIGTLGYGFVGQELEHSGYTTPQAIHLHKYLHKLCQQDAKYAAIEVSSHALAQSRVEGIPFESAIFTNLTQDHLDYHGNMEEYGRQKIKLFLKSGLRRTILNADDKFTHVLLNQMRRDIPVVLYSLNPKIKESYVNVKRPFISWVIVNNYKLVANGSQATITTPWGQGMLRTNLLGLFNLSNTLAVLSEICMQGSSLSEAISVLSQVQPAPGRMQRLGGIHVPQIIVDYAHTPEALKVALESARSHSKRRLWCVFGCGGDRDKSKRSQMGEIAAKLADRIILTNDNPRTENPSQIIGDILHGMNVDDGYKVVIEEDRKKAIEHALNRALPIDTVLIAGKGHENYQTIGSTNYPFSDIEIVKNLTGSKSA
jgi:UDP-N-acetylmuramoyl-L-alanyl-D-glutamate--2,6-diaminopimelate ligase